MEGLSFLIFKCSKREGERKKGAVRATKCKRLPLTTSHETLVRCLPFSTKVFFSGTSKLREIFFASKKKKRGLGEHKPCGSFHIVTCAVLHFLYDLHLQVMKLYFALQEKKEVREEKEIWK